MPFDLIALGETMLALAPPPGESVRSASRLLVDHAGAESNSCVGLARLGLRVGWVSRLGADAAGDRILDALGAERVDTQWVRRDATRPTGMMMKAPGAGVTYYRTGSAASEMNPDDLAGVPIADARAVLVTGITALIGPRPHALDWRCCLPPVVCASSIRICGEACGNPSGGPSSYGRSST